MHVCSLHLEAKFSEQNIFRAYHLWIGCDLFGEWMIKTTYGRIGSLGTSKTYFCASQEETIQKVNIILNRRASAPKRLGCFYVLKEVVGDTQCLRNLDSFKSLEDRLFSVRQ